MGALDEKRKLLLCVSRRWRVVRAGERESPERAREAALALVRYRAAGESAEAAAAAADARALGIVFLDAEEEAERSQPLPRMLR